MVLSFPRRREGGFTFEVQHFKLIAKHLCRALEFQALARCVVIGGHQVTWRSPETAASESETATKHCVSRCSPDRQLSSSRTTALAARRREGTGLCNGTAHSCQLGPVPVGRVRGDAQRRLTDKRRHRHPRVPWLAGKRRGSNRSARERPRRRSTGARPSLKSGSGPSLVSKAGSRTRFRRSSWRESDQAGKKTRA